MMGSKSVFFSGKFFIWDDANNLFCELTFLNDLPRKKKGGFLGFFGKKVKVDRDHIVFNLFLYIISFIEVKFIEFRMSFLIDLSRERNLKNLHLILNMIWLII